MFNLSEHWTVIWLHARHTYFESAAHQRMMEFSRRLNAGEQPLADMQRKREE
jgi:hypothetical protein